MAVVAAVGIEVGEGVRVAGPCWHSVHQIAGASQEACVGGECDEVGHRVELEFAAEDGG